MAPANTGIQGDFQGQIRLTPLYDFAPMYLHPDGIARRIRWEANDGGQPDWQRVVDRLCALGAQVQKERRNKGPALLAREALVTGLQAMVPALEEIATNGEALGLDTEVLQHLRPSLLARAQELSALR